MTDSRSAREILVDVISFTACANEGVGLDELLDRYRDEILDGQFLFHKNAELHERVTAVEAERDGAYRERAQLVALLAALYPAVLVPAPDVDEPGWQILYLTLPTGQASWHIHPRDADLYGHVQQVEADDPCAQWDGHTTVEKYQRIAQFAAEQAGADRYAAMVNAPLRPETIAAINERLRAGVVPVRKVKTRGADAES